MLLRGAEAFLLVSLQESRAEGTSVVRCSGEIAFPAPAACLCPCDARWREAWCSVSKPGRRNNGSGLLGKCVRRGLRTGCSFVGLWGFFCREMPFQLLVVMVVGGCLQNIGHVDKQCSRTKEVRNVLCMQSCPRAFHSETFSASKCLQKWWGDKWEEMRCSLCARCVHGAGVTH